MQDRIHYAPLAALPPGRARLLAAMHQAKAMYDWWVANPCFPHLLVELAPRIAPREVDAATKIPGSGMYYPTVTNIGQVEKYIAHTWPREASTADGGVAPDSEAVVTKLKVDEMHLAGRWWTPCVAIWICLCVCVECVRLTIRALVVFLRAGLCMRGRCRDSCRFSSR